MAAIGIHASHEQIAPSALLIAMGEAEAAGFAHAWSSDHFSPWSERQGESGFAWAWLGAPPLCWDLATVEQFDLAATHVRPEDMHGPVLISSDLQRHVAWIAELAELGFDAIYLHHVGQEQRRFIEAFGEHVLPAL